MLKVNISQLHGLHIPFYHSNQSAASFVHTSSEKSLAYIIKNWRKYFEKAGLKGHLFVDLLESSKIPIRYSTRQI